MSGERRFIGHPESAPGDFYVVNDDCLACGAPHAVAPDLIGWAREGTIHCIWKKQPESAAELEQALSAFDVSDIGCYRYAGSDRFIMERIGLEYCDHPGSRPVIVHEPRPAEFHPKLIGEHHGQAVRFSWALSLMGMAILVWIGTTYSC